MKKASLYVMAIFYTAAGANHFINADMYRKIMPPWLGWHEVLIGVSGVAEILLGLLLIPKLTRPVAAWGIIVLLVAVFPANIQMTINYLHKNNFWLWITILRLPLQFVLIWWAHLFTKPALRNN